MLAGIATAFFIYFVFGFFYWHSSIVGITGPELVAAVIGLAMIGAALIGLLDKRTPALSKVRFAGFLVFGVVMFWLSASTLYSDYAKPRLVLEGRADHLWQNRGSHYVDIGGRTVNVTPQLFERLKSKPYVRVEVGRGSNYIFNIEYLDN
jgi:hypothetical protein